MVDECARFKRVQQENVYGYQEIAVHHANQTMVHAGLLLVQNKQYCSIQKLLVWSKLYETEESPRPGRGKSKAWQRKVQDLAEESPRPGRGKSKTWQRKVQKLQIIAMQFAKSQKGKNLLAKASYLYRLQVAVTANTMNGRCCKDKNDEWSSSGNGAACFASCVRRSCCQSFFQNESDRPTQVTIRDMHEKHSPYQFNTMTLIFYLLLDKI